MAAEPLLGPQQQVCTRRAPRWLVCLPHCQIERAHAEMFGRSIPSIHLAWRVEDDMLEFAPTMTAFLVVRKNRDTCIHWLLQMAQHIEFHWASDSRTHGVNQFGQGADFPRNS